jgi:hypothetical protein
VAGENAKERRAFLRVPITSGFIEYYLPGHPYQRSDLINVSIEGCFIARAPTIKPKSEIIVFFRLPGNIGLLELPGEVMWLKWAKKKDDKTPLGVGVKFSLTEEKRLIMESFISYMRNMQIIAMSQRIVEAFWGEPKQLPATTPEPPPPPSI